MVEVIKQMMMSDPHWQVLVRTFSSDKQLAIKVLQKQREMFIKPEVIQMYVGGYDPATHDGLVKFVDIYERLDRMVMEECGLGEYIKDVKLFKILKLIVPLYMGDPEVMAMLDYMVKIGNPMVEPDIGSVPPDVNLVSIETKEACVLSGSLAKLFSDYQDRVRFLCIYLAEAHPKGKWNFGPRFCYMEEHKTIDDRIQAARDLIATDSVHNTFKTNLSDTTKIPLVMDSIDNNFAVEYSAHPDRVIIIGSDVKIAFVGRVIALQLDQPQATMADEARYWLEQNL